MWVKNYMHNRICITSKDEKISDAIKKMVEQRTNSLIVVDENQKPIGILSSYTLVREVVPAYLKEDSMVADFSAEGTFDRYAEKIKDKTVEEVMHTDFHILSEDDTMIEAATYSIKASRRILPIVGEDGKMIGAITRTCIKNALHNAIFRKEKVEFEEGGCSACGCVNPNGEEGEAEKDIDQE